MGARVHLQAVVVRHLLYQGLHLLGREEEARLPQAEGYVLGHGEGRHEPEVLVDHAYAQLYGVPRPPDVDLTPLHQDAALIGPVEAVEDVHERGLASPILAQEGVHLPGPQLKVHPIVRHHAGEALGDTYHPD